ncbi:hypothetical protein [Flavobacterium aestivum]|uniref:hypothetical protein n=1 Tax=Flavobacterium aestivum TaxID=3003257 RepID=UPI002482BE70|nr:hypothetical protein [Flavobacterium aestivum]
MYINEALNFNILRFSGKKETLENRKLKLSNYENGNGIYSLGVLSKRLDFEEILYSLKNETLYNNLKSESFTKNVFEDIFYIMEILLRIFKFHEPFYINDRLKNFCYVNILLNNSKNVSTEDVDLSFKNLLFFNPCSEEFINRNQLRNGEYLNNERLINFYSCFEDIFEAIFKLKKEKNAYHRIAKGDIELLYAILKELISTVFEAQPNTLPKEYLKFENILKNEKKLYDSLLKSIDYFTLINNKVDNKTASLYYQSEKPLEIVNLAKRNSKVKFKSEYIIDSYIFRFSKQPDEFINFLSFLKEQDAKKYIKFSIILLSHPFIIYNLESKKNLIESNLYKTVPDKGYAYQKLIKYKELFQ